jgi:HSP20 family protein
MINRHNVSAEEETMTKEEKKSGKDIEPARGTMAPFEEMERWFENAIGGGWMRPFRMRWPAWSDFPVAFEGRMPKVDVIDRDAEVVVRAEVPGVKKEDLEVSVSDGTVTIKGEMKHEEKKEKGDYYRSEISRGSFLRTVMLPGYVDPDQVKSSFKDGVLELTLPKVEKTKRRTIKVE